MKSTWLVGFLLLGAVALASIALGNAVILQVPDWNQPSAYTPPGGGLYNDWCGPTAGANVMGYWEDLNGKTGLADGQAFTATPAYGGNVGWQQGLWHDGIVEMGWFMDTNNWRTTLPNVFPPTATGGTSTADIGPGLTNYAAGSWTDPTPPGPGLVRTPYGITITGDAWNLVPGNTATAWSNYMAEINASRPVLVMFDTWLNSGALLGTHDILGDTQHTAYEYAWGTTEMHVVTGVGWMDPTPGQLASGDEYFIVQDGWQTTQPFVAVPLVELSGAGTPPTLWRESWYVTVGDEIIQGQIPEPATLMLALLGWLLLVGWRGRRQVCG